MPQHHLNNNRLSAGTRCLLATCGSIALMLCAIAGTLSPDPRGFGTHEQLGLTPCRFYQWTGRPCPTCGTTTAWTLVMKGHMAAAVKTNLSGALLCVAILVLAPWVLMSAAWGGWLVMCPNLWWIMIAGSVWMAVAIIDWLQRVWF